MTAVVDALPLELMEALRSGRLSQEQAQAIYRCGEGAVVFALLWLAQQLARQQSQLAAESHQTPSTPSGMQPPWRKSNSKSNGGRRRRGAQPGHPGHCRPLPEQINRRRVHRLKQCPHCGGRVRRSVDARTRYIEDIPETKPQVTEHTIHRHWCPRCKKLVEPVVTEALPQAWIGNRALCLSAWLHYGVGVTLSQIGAVFEFHFHFRITAGGLMRMWYRLAAVLAPWYEQIQQEAQASAVLHADESGWRVAGRTHWLWCFTNAELTYYMIEGSRGSEAVLTFFREEFGGTLVTDFWSAYNAVLCQRRQCCLAHLLRELKHVEQYKSPGGDWGQFHAKLKRLIKDAIRLKQKQAELPGERYESRRLRLERRLDELIEQDWQEQNAKRLAKRLRKHRDNIFPFLYDPAVPYENNAAERAIRPAVLMRKNSYGNGSDRGAACQAVLMSIFRTLKQRGHDPIQTVVSALEHYIKTGRLPPLPTPKDTSSG